MKRVIVHADMDAFFAAVEELDHPEFRGNPVIVGSDPENGKGRGVVSTCNYEARKFGIHSAMPISRAWKLCPHGIYVSPRMERYSEISNQIMAVFASFSPLVEPLSLDEAFLDCTGTNRLFGDVESLGRRIKKRIREKTGLTVSVGIAANKFMAKVASDLEKPDGLTICPEGEEREFLKNLPIRKLWGVGPKTGERMQKIGIRTIGDLAAMEESNALFLLGNQGAVLHRLSRGEDERPVIPYSDRKSISEERTFRVDREDRGEIEAVVFRLADHLARRMRGENLSGKTLQLKIRTASFQTITRSKTFPEPLYETHSIAKEAWALFLKHDPGSPIRLIGVGLSNLSDQKREEDLFRYAQRQQEDKMDRVIDTLKEKFRSRVGRAVFFQKKDSE